MNDQNILIVGGAGYIGSHINKMLHKAGYRTVILDNLSNGNKKTVKYGEFIEGDLGDKQLLDRIFKEYPIKAVMHFAAFIDVGESISHPIKYYQNNVTNTLSLLETMIKNACMTFIFSSTAAIFGHPHSLPMTEEHPCHPINPYGETKWMIEKILRSCDTAYGLKSCCLRYFNAAGGDPEGEINNYQKQSTNLIPLLLKNLKSGTGALTVFGSDYPTKDGTCIRDYIHIDDLGTAHIKGLEQLLSGKPSSYYNLGNGNGYTVREVIHAAEKVTGKRAHINEGPRRQGDPPQLIADSKKAYKDLNWKPQYPALETMIQHAWIALDS